MKITVKNEWDTIQKIIKERKSIARYGDGEFKLCRGFKQIAQEFCSDIARNLLSILRSTDPNLLVGIPRIFEQDMSWMPDKKFEFWSRLSRNKKVTQMLEPGKIYYSAFITRPDSVPMIDTPEYWNLCKQIWKDQNVVLLQGEGREFERSGVFEFTKRLDRIYGPRKNAFAHRKELVRTMLQFPEDSLFIISLGPTATILAADLSAKGRWVLDMGHFGVFYDGRAPKSSHWTGELYDHDKR